VQDGAAPHAEGLGEIDRSGVVTISASMVTRSKVGVTLAGARSSSR
jgi:hypothetical protein